MLVISTPACLRRAGHTIHDRRRIVRDGKHPPIRLGLGLDPAFGEPRDHVARLEFVKRPEQLAPAARIFFHEFARFEARVRHIAAPAAGHPHLGQRMRRRLVDRDITGRAEFFRAGDGREKSRRPAPDNHHAPFVRHARTLRAGPAKAKRKSAVPHAADTKMAVAGCNPRRP
jgi:hypothetical protein